VGVQGSSFVMEGVKNLVVKRHNLPATRIVDALMEMKSLPEVEDFRYFDPKMLRADRLVIKKRKKKEKKINSSLLSHMEKLLVARVERLLWLRRGSNPVPFSL
jgi:hypothetical protein